MRYITLEQVVGPLWMPPVYVTSITCGWVRRDGMSGCDLLQCLCQCYVIAGGTGVKGWRSNPPQYPNPLLGQETGAAPRSSLPGNTYSEGSSFQLILQARNMQTAMQILIILRLQHPSYSPPSLHTPALPSFLPGKKIFFIHCLRLYPFGGILVVFGILIFAIS